jgi:LPS sulfotransferase NodH
MKAIILTSQRSGSTFLQHCLDGHPSIRCYGELLIGHGVVAPKLLEGHRMVRKMWRMLMARPWNPAGTMDRCFADEVAPVVAFRAMYNHVADPRARRYLLEHPEIRIIHLRRDNLLKQHVSKVLLGSRRERPTSHTTSSIAPVSVRVSPKRAINDMRRVRDRFIKFEKLLSGRRKIELVYEDMVSGQTLTREAWKKIAELLEIEPARTESVLVKMNPNRLRPMVENYDELADALTGTEWERYLDPVSESTA